MLEWIIVAAWLLGLAMGAWMGWWMWRRPTLRYEGQEARG